MNRSAGDLLASPGAPRGWRLQQQPVRAAEAWSWPGSRG